MRWLLLKLQWRKCEKCLISNRAKLFNTYQSLIDEVLSKINHHQWYHIRQERLDETKKHILN